MVVKDEPAERKIKLPGAPKRGRIRFAVVSDTHLGHIKQQLTHWRDFAQRAEKWGAEFVLHVGDLVDGTNMHRDQQYEIFKHGADQQAMYAREALPKVLGRESKKPVMQYVIGGNHDGAFYNDSGANVLRTLCDGRPDIKFLGAPTAEFHISGLRILLMHPDGGVAYARSYKPQKIVEQFAPDQKPNIVLLGHWHVADYLPAYRNVETLSMPCFQAQTAFMKSKGLAPVVGGLLVECEYSPQGLESFTPRFELYRTHLNSDYP